MQAKSDKFVGYFRVSTDRQGRSGLGLEAQREVVQHHLNSVCGTLIAEHVEVESGKRHDRPELQTGLTARRRHKAKLLIAKQDRASPRSLPLCQRCPVFRYPRAGRCCRLNACA